MSNHKTTLPPTALWKRSFIAFTLLISTGAVVQLLLTGTHFHRGTVMLVLWAGIYAATLVLACLHLRPVSQLVVKAKLLWLLVGWAFISMAWSEAPWVTLRNSVALLGTTAFGVYLALCYTRERLWYLLLSVFGALAVLSLGVVLWLPAYGVGYYDQNVVWQGVFTSKNMLGSMMALGALFWLIHVLDYPKERLLAIGGLFLSLLLLFFSHSITALLVFGTVIIVLLVLLIFRQGVKGKGPAVPALVSLGLLLVYLMVGHWGSLLALLGRNETLTGRTVLWQGVWDLIRQRPWLGWGYRSYWSEAPPGDLWSLVDWYPPHAHNGYLDLWLQLGLVGVLIFMFSLGLNLYRAWAGLRHQNRFMAVFPLLFLVFLLVHNLAESTILFRNSVFWILYVVFSVQLSMDVPKQNQDGG